MLARVEATLSQVLGASVTITAQENLLGGCINKAQVLQTSHGGFFLKSHACAPSGLFAAEAAGLEALRATSSLTIPKVIAYEEQFLVLEFMKPAPRTGRFDEVLGSGLARLHSKTHARGFGFDISTYCGTTLQRNPWTPNWIDFYRDQRLSPLVKHLVDAGAFDRSAHKMSEALLSKLHERLASPEEPSALIHGDLWSGNLHTTAGGQPVLIDPAAYYGHREAEIGMMTLFGGFGPKVFDAYEAARPLAPGWRARNPLYELYHVMNHAHLFGGSYVTAALGTIRRFA